MHKKNVMGQACEKLRAEIRRQGLTPNGAAELMDGVSHQSIRNLLSGRTSPWEVRVSTAQEICRVFRRRLMIKDFYRPSKAV